MVREYHEGDKVVIKSMTEASYIEDCKRMFGVNEVAEYVTGMREYMGDSAEIVRALPDHYGSGLSVYEIDIDRQRYWWDAAMFEDGEITFDVKMDGAEDLI